MTRGFSGAVLRRRSDRPALLLRVNRRRATLAVRQSSSGLCAPRLFRTVLRRRSDRPALLSRVNRRRATLAVRQSSSGLCAPRLFRTVLRRRSDRPALLSRVNRRRATLAVRQSSSGLCAPRLFRTVLRRRSDRPALLSRVNRRRATEIYFIFSTSFIRPSPLKCPRLPLGASVSEYAFRESGVMCFPQIAKGTGVRVCLRSFIGTG